MKVDKTKWMAKPISSFFDLQMGKTPSRKSLELWKNGDTPWVSIADMNDVKFISSTKEMLSTATIKQCNIPIVPKGIVIMSFKLTIGKTCITCVPLTTNEAIMAFYPKKEIQIDQSFLCYVLSAIKWRGNRAVKGMTINKKTISQKVISLPNFTDQKAIASELDAIQTMIDGYKAQLDDLDALAQSIFLDMFGDPVANPKGWEVSTLENIVAKDCPITYGIVQPGDDVENGIPVVRPVDLIDTYVKRLMLKTVSRDISNSYRRTILKGSEILICVRGTTGIVSFATEELKGCNVTRGIVPLSFDKQNKWFMFWCIKSVEMNCLIQKLTKGVTLKQINIKDLRQLPFPVPPIKLQERFGMQAELIETQKALLKGQLADSETLMAERMQYYFS